MEWIVEKGCSDYQTAVNCIPIFQPCLEALLCEAGLNSLDYFVIADSNEAYYRETVEKYASIVGTETNVTQDGNYFAAGKTLCGIDKTGRIHQAIVIKSRVWIRAAIEYAWEQRLLPKEMQDSLKPSCLDRSIIIHEIGHAVDNDCQFVTSGTVNTRTQYNLKYEYDEYIEQTALSLWGEYYAESFACKRVPAETDSSIRCKTNLLNCLKSFSPGTDFYAILERVYRILYFSMFWLATRHQQFMAGENLDYNSIWQDPIASEYRPLLSKLERAIDNLELDYPKWGSYERLNELTNLIKDFLTFEQRRQLRIKLLGR